MREPRSGRGPRSFRLRAVVFDFDGTLTRPGALDFPGIKREVGCPPDSFLLEWIEALPASRLINLIRKMKKLQMHLFL